MARAKDRLPSPVPRARGARWGRRLAALAAGVVAGVVVGALLADRGDELLPRARTPRRDRDRDGARPGGDGRRPIRDVTAGGASTRGTGVAAPAADVEARVLEAFRNDPILVERPIDIGAIGTGIVELSGWVDTPAEIRHATTLARGTIGVSTVVNRLAVRGTPDVG
jgi:hypothetical protein